MSVIIQGGALTALPASLFRLPDSSLATRGRFWVLPGGLGELGRLPTDPLGNITATFDGVHAGSEIRIFSLAGIERAGVESCDDDHVLTWGVYGSPDTVIVRIVNVAYKIKEFNLNVSKGTMNIPVQQEPDPWYSNP